MENNALQITLQVVALLFVLVGFLQKKKWLVLLLCSLGSFTYVGMYLIYGRIAGASICFVSAAKCITYMFFSIKNIKPNIFVFAFFEIAYIVGTALTWQDALDLLPLVAMLQEGYTTWQDNKWIFRIGYMISPILFLIYKAIISAWISMAGEALMFVIALFSFVYYCIMNKQQSILEKINFFKRKLDRKNEDSIKNNN